MSESLQVLGFVQEDGERKLHILINDDGAFNRDEVKLDKIELEHYIHILTSDVSSVDIGPGRQRLLGFIMTLEDKLEELTLGGP